MSITTIVVAWLLLLTIAIAILSVAGLYLYRTGEGTRLEGMALRARLNRLPNEGITVRATPRNHTIPPTKKVEVDLTHFEYISDLED
jgi:hypothetical protein